MVLVRTYAALELIHACVLLVVKILFFIPVIPVMTAGAGNAVLVGEGIASWMAPLELAAVGLVLLVASKSIAR